MWFSLRGPGEIKWDSIQIDNPRGNERGSEVRDGDDLRVAGNEGMCPFPYLLAGILLAFK